VRTFEAAQARARHAAHFAGIATHHAGAAHDNAWHERMLAILADLRVAWHWSAEHVAVDLLADLGAPLARWYEMTGRYREWESDFAAATVPVRAALAAARIPGQDLRTALGLVLVGQARALQYLGHARESRDLLVEADTLLEAEGPVWTARIGLSLGRSLHMLGEFDAARERFSTALAAATSVGLDDCEAQLFAALGMLALAEGDELRAASLCDQAFAIVQARGDQEGYVAVAVCLGAVAHAQGDLPRAHYRFTSSLDLARALTHRPLETAALRGLAELACEQHHPSDEARTLCSDAVRLARTIGDPVATAAALSALGRLALMVADLEHAETAFAEALACGVEAAGLAEAGAALRGLGGVAFYRGNLQEALDLTARALTSARRHWPREIGPGALLLGHIRLALGDLAGAANAYEEARASARLSPAIDAEAGLARIDLARGDTRQALVRVAALLPSILSETPAAIEDPVRTYLACYRTLIACGDPRAPQLLATGHAWLHERAAAIDNPDARRRFLQVPPHHRELLSVWREASQHDSVVIALPTPLALAEHIAVS
jgi:tetratricopeptide (TPR) repeat protein